MFTQQTLDKLYDLRLSAMARAYAEQLERTDAVGLSFEERLGLLVDREWQARQERRCTMRLKNAKVKQAARVEDIDYRHPRNLDKSTIQDLLT